MIASVKVFKSARAFWLYGRGQVVSDISFNNANRYFGFNA